MPSPVKTSPGTGVAEHKKMPVIFIGHGSPQNAIDDNEFSRAWKELGKTLPKPRAVLCISAHWETTGTLATAMEKPRTVHDFGGFPRELYEVEYPASGSSWLADMTKKVLAGTNVGLDHEWGLDHGTWSVLKNIYPQADIPIVQLSLDYNKSPGEHYALGRKLAELRRKDVLIIGSGNMVHNLGLVYFGKKGFGEPFGFDWALEANGLFKKLIDEDRHEDLVGYKSLGKSVRLAVPTPEHFLPLLYVLALKEKGERVRYFNDKPVAGSLSMTSVVIG